MRVAALHSSLMYWAKFFALISEGLPVIKRSVTYPACILGVIYLLILWGRFGTNHSTPASEASASKNGLPTSLSNGSRDQPLSIRPLVQRLIPVNDETIKWIRTFSLPDEEETFGVSHFCHVLRMHGLRQKLPRSNGAGETIVGMLTSDVKSKEYYGYPAVVKTRSGIRFPTVVKTKEDPSREVHQDQCLACFAEQGMSLDFPLTVAGQKVPLRGVLEDSIANFHLKQPELDWTLIAYALYLPPENKWTNRYGEDFSFDDLVTEMMSRRYRELTCYGTHTLYGLTLLLRANEDLPVLSDSARNLVRTRLEVVLQHAISTQRPDGAWQMDWHKELLESLGERAMLFPPTSTGDLHATSHLAEWMLFLPVDLQPPQDVYLRSAIALREMLTTTSSDVLKKNFCPCTHAARTLRELCYIDDELDDSHGAEIKNGQ